MKEQEHIERVLEQVKDIGVGMLSTTSSSGDIRSRPMMNLHNGINKEFLYFFSDDETEKIYDISNNSKVLVTYSDREKKTHVSIRGRASIIKDKNQFERFWSPTVSLWYPNGIEDERICLIAIKTEFLEYWESEINPFVKAFEIAVSAFDGKRPSLTEHERINLKN